MDDKLPPFNWSLRPEARAYRLPQRFLGLAPTFWTMPTPPLPSSDVWTRGRISPIPLGPPPGRVMLGQLTQLIDPPTSQTVWNLPTFRTRFLQPVSEITAQLNSSSYQSSAPADSPNPLGPAEFASAPVRPSTDPSPDEVGG